MLTKPCAEIKKFYRRKEEWKQQRSNNRPLGHSGSSAML
jgi:hypothetical protein